MKNELNLRVQPNWNEMGMVNQTALDFLTASALSEEAVNMYTMIVCELVENSIKYGDFRHSDDTIHVQVGITRKNISVQVSNPISQATQPYLQDLDRMVQWIRGFQDPFEAYVQRMKAISREPIEVDKSGLGIVRITYEGRAILDFFVREDNTLNVSVVSSIA